MRTERIKKRQPPPKNPFRLVAFLGAGLIFLGALCWACIQHGNPQWHKQIYLYQTYTMKHNGGQPLNVPKTYTGEWRTWNKNGSLQSSYLLQNGKFLKATTYTSKGKRENFINFSNPSDIVWTRYNTDGTVMNKKRYRFAGESDPYQGRTYFKPGLDMPHVGMVELTP